MAAFFPALTLLMFLSLTIIFNENTNKKKVSNSKIIIFKLRMELSLKIDNTDYVSPCDNCSHNLLYIHANETHDLKPGEACFFNTGIAVNWDKSIFVLLLLPINDHSSSRYIFIDYDINENNELIVKILNIGIVMVYIYKEQKLCSLNFCVKKSSILVS